MAIIIAAEFTVATVDASAPFKADAVGVKTPILVAAVEVELAAVDVEFEDEDECLVCS